MKIICKTKAMGVLLLLFIVISCSKNSSAPGSPATTQHAVTSGTWFISSYTQKTENKTGDYSGMIFTFATDGKLTVSGSTTASGTWSKTSASAGYYGGPPSLATFTISLGNSKPFDKLSKTWNVADSSSIILALDNKEPTEDEHITFTKKQ